MAENCKTLVGAEIVEDAIKNANENAKANGIENARFICADASKAAAQLKAEGLQPDVVVLDPPRKGCGEDVILTVAQMSPKRVVYVSCDPATLARDLEIFESNGYKTKEVTPCDMFPRTAHVETVVKLVKKTPDTYIDITVDMDELDLTASEAKATYEEIKQYILDKYDTKVSNLYIAQVKEKCGIIERENYNKPKSANTKQSQCPAEKAVMIEEAFKHFKMI